MVYLLGCNSLLFEVVYLVSHVVYLSDGLLLLLLVLVELVVFV